MVKVKLTVTMRGFRTAKMSNLIDALTLAVIAEETEVFLCLTSARS